jgi:hypothetical protein
MVHTRHPLRSRWAASATLIGTLFVVGAFVWWFVAPPLLVKYPTDVDVSPRYSGTFTMFANAETFAPLASPATVPLTIDRRIESIADESGASRVVVRETIRQRAGDLFDTTQQNQYVMNRRTLLNVADSRAYAFDPGNIVDRSGSYRLQLPFDTPSGATLTLYQNEIGATYPFAGTGVVSEVEGLTLHEFAAVAGPMPIDDAYLAELQKAMPVPVSLTSTRTSPPGPSPALVRRVSVPPCGIASSALKRKFSNPSRSSAGSPITAGTGERSSRMV